mmetsp:Transcript_334/g.1057  ORF Transcript_334/g.1057 Transcript_334/m.1057 type:complete len:824 (-) Transcript_334:61-2532(-)
MRRGGAKSVSPAPVREERLPQRRAKSRLDAPQAELLALPSLGKTMFDDDDELDGKDSLGVDLELQNIISKQKEKTHALNKQLNRLMARSEFSELSLMELEQQYQDEATTMQRDLSDDVLNLRGMEVKLEGVLFRLGEALLSQESYRCMIDRLKKLRDVSQREQTFVSKEFRALEKDVEALIDEREEARKAEKHATDVAALNRAAHDKRLVKWERKRLSMMKMALSDEENASPEFLNALQARTRAWERVLRHKLKIPPEHMQKLMESWNATRRKVVPSGTGSSSSSSRARHPSSSTALEPVLETAASTSSSSGAGALRTATGQELAAVEPESPAGWDPSPTAHAGPAAEAPPSSTASSSSPLGKQNPPLPSSSSSSPSSHLIHRDDEAITRIIGAPETPGTPEMENDVNFWLTRDKEQRVKRASHAVDCLVNLQVKKARDEGMELMEHRRRVDELAKLVKRTTGLSIDDPDSVAEAVKAIRGDSHSKVREEQQLKEERLEQRKVELSEAEAEYDRLLCFGDETDRMDQVNDMEKVVESAQSTKRDRLKHLKRARGKVANVVTGIASLNERLALAGVLPPTDEAAPDPTADDDDAGAANAAEGGVHASGSGTGTGAGGGVGGNSGEAKRPPIEDTGAEEVEAKLEAILQVLLGLLHVAGAEGTEWGGPDSVLGASLGSDGGGIGGGRPNVVPARGVLSSAASQSHSRDGAGSRRLVAEEGGPIDSDDQGYDSMFESEGEHEEDEQIIGDRQELKDKAEKLVAKDKRVRARASGASGASSKPRKGAGRFAASSPSPGDVGSANRNLPTGFNRARNIRSPPQRPRAR